MNKKIFLKIVLICFLFLGKNSFSLEIEANNSPYDVVYNHTYYLNKNHYDELKAAESFHITRKKERIKAAKTLYEILNGKGIDVNAMTSKIPSNPDFVDSATRRNIYVLYDKLPEVFVEKVGDKWYYSQYTVDALSRIHAKIFPFGSNIWAKWFSFIEDKIVFRLHLWQWIGIGIVLSVFFILFLFTEIFLSLLVQ